MVVLLLLILFCLKLRYLKACYILNNSIELDQPTKKRIKLSQYISLTKLKLKTLIYTELFLKYFHPKHQNRSISGFYGNRYIIL